jgi:hypothetical protein
MRRVRVLPFQPFEQMFNKRREHVKTMMGVVAALVLAASGCSEPAARAPSEQIEDGPGELRPVPPEKAPAPSTEFKKVEAVVPTRHVHSEAVATLVAAAPAPVLCAQGQIYANARHSGGQCAEIPDLGLVTELIQQPDADRQAAARGGFLSVHYATALTSKTGWVYVPSKRGFTNRFNLGSQTWSVDAYQWVGAQLVRRWSVDTTWKPFDSLNPSGSTTSGYEQLFQPALTSNGLYVPSAAGQISRLNPTTGALIAQIDPLAGTTFSGDASTMVNSALTADDQGRLYFTVVAWDPTGDISIAPRESWLVRLAPNNQFVRVAWDQIATSAIGLPQGNDLCNYPFGTEGGPPVELPFPPSPDAVPPQFGCGDQRPPVNTAPAVKANGNVVLITSNNNAVDYAFIVEFSFATMAPVWGNTFRERIKNGCGVLIPINGPDNSRAFHCRFGSRIGISPEFNEFFSGRTISLSEAAPVIAPDGSVYFSTYETWAGHDKDHGSVHHFSATGEFLSVKEYGFEQSPAIVPNFTGGGYTLAQDYSAPGEFGLAAATARLTAAQTLLAVTRVPPIGEESNDWLNGQPAVDTKGNVYGLNASGDLYKIDRNGMVLDSLHLDRSLVALNSEPSWGSDGLGRPVLYVSYGGKVFVIGQAAGTN